MSVVARSIGWFSELRRRHVLRVLGIYLVGLWGLLQAVDLLAPALDIPDAAIPVLLATGLIGLPFVFAFAWFYDFSRHAGIVRTEERAPRRVRMVVLPFRSLTPGAEADALAFSLADAVACSLVGVRSLVVRSTMSVAKYQSVTPDLKALAREEEVDVVMTGTILRRDAVIELRAQLLRVPEGTVVWAHNAEFDITALSGCQADLARRVVQSLGLTLDAREQKQLAASVPTSPQAYELYLRANHLGQSAQWARAIELYLECVDLEPTFAPAWARLGRCYRLLAKYSLDDKGADQNLLMAGDAFQHALQLDPELSLAHSLYAQLEIDLGRAEEAMVRLLARSRITGFDADILAGLVHACRYCGLLDASVAAHKRARALDPHAPTSVAHSYFMQGRYQEARADHTATDLGYLVALTAVMLNEADAYTIVDAHVQAQAGTFMEPYLRALRAVLDNDAAQVHESLQQAFKSQALARDGEALFYAARKYARVGDAAHALEYLDRAISKSYACAPAYENDPWLDSLRGSAEFVALLARAQARQRQAIDAFHQTGGGVLFSS